MGTGWDLDISGNVDKYDHVTFNISSWKMMTELSLTTPSQTNGETVWYRIQEGSAIDLDATDLLAGTFTDADVTNTKNILSDSGNTIVLNGGDNGKDYAILFYNEIGVSTPLYYKVEGSTVKEPEPEP